MKTTSQATWRIVRKDNGPDNPHTGIEREYAILTVQPFIGRGQQLQRYDAETNTWVADSGEGRLQCYVDTRSDSQIRHSGGAR